MWSGHIREGKTPRLWDDAAWWSSGDQSHSQCEAKTIEPFIKDIIIPGTLIYTDEYGIYARLPSWGYKHKSGNHGRGEFARDEDGDGFCEVHVNTMEGFWSLLRS